ncbi:MAG: hypothetical protein K1060chlam2_00275 [Chlamydiae bacterium]|nr:hypothetical protein [Chlamydiota bacterium]
MIFFWKESSFYNNNFRADEAESALEVFKATNVPLVALDDSGYHASGLSDSNGYYYFISQIANYFDVSALSANKIFHGLLLFLGVLIAFICFMLIFKSWILRLISIPGFIILAYTA